MLPVLIPHEGPEELGSSRSLGTFPSQYSWLAAPAAQPSASSIAYVIVN
jgi:hypothetical protein